MNSSRFLCGLGQRGMSSYARLLRDCIPMIRSAVGQQQRLVSCSDHGFYFPIPLEGEAVDCRTAH